MFCRAAVPTKQQRIAARKKKRGERSTCQTCLATCGGVAIAMHDGEGRVKEEGDDGRARKRRKKTNDAP